MIKANELRLGNWVYSLFIAHEPKKIPTQIISITGDNTDGQYDEMEPIPITQEILKKCGFLKDDLGDYCKEIMRKGLRVTPGQESDFILPYRDDVGINYSVIGFVESVHKLQNLYFELTGKELEVKF